MRVPGTAPLPPLFPGVPDLLRGLQREGYRLAVATGKSRLGLDRSLANHPELAGVFELTRCADETADKPNPRMLNEILAATGVGAEAALMIGDTEYDAAMARAIAMDAVGVATGVHDAGRQQRAGASTVLGDVAALPGWLGRR
jgi:phosphoglycolate phosphatase